MIPDRAAGRPRERLRADVRRTFTTARDVEFAVDVDLAVGPGETLVILGPSGSGKTLLLETIAGFHDHEGRVTLGGRDLTAAPPEDRDFGFVFQEYALFPHRTARENVAFGQRYHDGGRDPGALLSDLGVAHLADRYPPTLSGGEKQRVALARSLAIDPEVLLLDEPLSALDVPTRQSLREDLADAIADVTAVYVTHNRTTARALADRVAVMNDGELVQVGDPESVFERPETSFVARFTGANCLSVADLPGDAAVSDVPAEGAHVVIRPEYVHLDPPGGAAASADGGRVEPGGAAPAPRSVATREPEDAPIRFSATVDRVLREDAAYRVSLSAGSTSLEALTSDPPALDDVVEVVLPRDRVHVL